MKVTYKDSGHLLTLEDCLKVHECGVDVVIDEGKHVTFEIKG